MVYISAQKALALTFVSSVAWVREARLGQRGVEPIVGDRECTAFSAGKIPEDIFPS